MKSIIISSILSLVITGHNPVQFSNPANIIYTPYGTCTYYYSLGSLDQEGAFSGLLNGILFDSDLSMTFVHYEFAGQATGQFDLNVYTRILDNTGLSSHYRIFVQGGYLISVPSTDGDNTPDVLRFQVVDSRSMDILIIHPGWNQPAILQPALSNQNITLTQTENATINEILNYVSYDSGQIQNIKADTTMIKNLLISMSGYSADSNDNIATDMDTLISAITQINNENNYFSNLDLPSYSWSFYRLLSRKYTISTGNIFPRPYFSVTTDNTTNFSWDYAIQLNAGDIYIVMATYDSSSPNVKFINSSGNDVTSYWAWNFKYVGRLRYYYTKVPSNLINNSVNIKFTANMNVMPIYIGRLRNMPLEVNQLIDIDSNDAYIRKMAEIKNSIENMAVNVNNMTVNATGITYNVNNTQVNNSVTTYNTNINQVYNVENNFGTQLDTQLQNYNPDNTTIISRLTASGNIMSTVLNGINGIELFTVPIAVMLVGIVLLAIVG